MAKGRKRIPPQTKLDLVSRITRLPKATVKMILDTSLLLDLVELEQHGTVRNQLVTVRKQNDAVTLELGELAHNMMSGTMDIKTILNYLSHKADDGHIT